MEKDIQELLIEIRNILEVMKVINQDGVFNVGKIAELTKKKIDADDEEYTDEEKIERDTYLARLKSNRRDIIKCEAEFNKLRDIINGYCKKNLRSPGIDKVVREIGNIHSSVDTFETVIEVIEEDKKDDGWE